MTKIEEVVARHTGDIKTLFSSVDKMELAIIEIRDKLIYRPTWAVLAIFTILGSTCTGLILALVNIACK